MKNKIFVWNYHYFFYTLFKHACNEKFISDFPKVAALTQIMIWWGVIFATVVEFVTSACILDHKMVYGFLYGSGDSSKYIYPIIFFVINFFYFSKHRIEKIESKYNVLPMSTRKIGNVISWVVFVAPMAAFLYVGLMITPCYMVE